MSKLCPHCGVVLPATVDAFCPECREDLDESPDFPLAEGVNCRLQLSEFVGAEGMTLQEFADEIRRGGKLITYQYCISIGIMTFLRTSKVHLVRCEESVRMKGWEYILISLLVGWWGVPWGFVYTPLAVFNNLHGGADVTAAFLPYLPRPNSVDLG